MERELNVHWMELVDGVGWGNTLLAAQLLRHFLPHRIPRGGLC